MKRFVEGECRTQVGLFPKRLDDWIGEDKPVGAVDAFVDVLDFKALGFESAEPAEIYKSLVAEINKHGVI